MGDGTGIIESHYDASGFLERSVDAAGIETLYTYFDDGAVATVTNAENETTTYAYDIFGNVALTTKPKGASYQQRSTYDERNRLVSVEDALGNTSTFVYDDNDNLLHQFNRLPTIPAVPPYTLNTPTTC